MVLYHIISALLLVGFLGLILRGAVREEIETSLGGRTKSNKVFAYFGYVTIIITISYLWPISLIVLAIVLLVLWSIRYDYSRR